MCCSGLLKILMFIVNGAIFLVGAGLLGVGVWVTLDSDSMLGFLDHIENAPAELKQLANVGYLLIGLGIGLGFIGFLGCCGAMKESRCMLLTFFIIVLIIFLAEVAGAIVLFVFQPLVEELLRDIEVEVAASIEKTYGDDEALSTFWNTTMDELKCCGYRNYTDFTGSPFVSTFNIYPQACCNPGAACTLDNAQLAYSSQNVTGCFDTLVTLIEDNAGLVGGVALGIGAVEIFAMIFAMILYKRAGK